MNTVFGGASKWGHEPRKNAQAMRRLGVEKTCGPWHWGLRWSSLWGSETCDGRLDAARESRRPWRQSLKRISPQGRKPGEGRADMV
eukprot:2730106-Pyramimonas_sp.AAC.1